MVLSFEDLDDPVPDIVTPTEKHVREIVEFGRRHHRNSMLVLCNAGISRSTASALVVLADRAGSGNELGALAAVLERQLDAVPNLLVICHADIQLERSGALIDCVLRWDAGRPANQSRRTANPRAVLQAMGALEGS